MKHLPTSIGNDVKDFFSGNTRSIYLYFANPSNVVTITTALTIVFFIMGKMNLFYISAFFWILAIIIKKWIGGEWKHG